MKRDFKIAAIAVAITLSGCASDSDSTASLPLETNQSQAAVQIDSFVQSLENAEKTLAATKSTELDWFASIQMRDAKKALAEAKEYYAEFELDPSQANSSSGFFSSKTNLQAAEESIAAFNTHVTKAETIRAEALTILEDAFSYRDQLETINAAKYYPKTAKQLEQKLKRLVDNIASDNADKAVSAQPELVRKQRALEVRTVTRIYLSDAQKELKRLKTARIGMHAPETLAQAAAAVTAAEAFITAEPRATQQIINKADEAMFSLNHAQQIAIVVKKLKAMPEKDYERHVLSYEKILLNISLALGAEDMRDQAISKQGKNLVKHIKDNLQGEQETLIAQQKVQSELADEKMRVTILEQKIAQLSAQLLAAEQAPSVAPLKEVVPVKPVSPVKSAAVTQEKAPVVSEPAAQPVEVNSEVQAVPTESEQS
ncbi:hypothetical protein MD588_02140 [Photobacterium sp. SDRW27]|uniref:hypothetical protein n=1 Tax=Photobacterium obscurum TaxID=2829490 RepID=UPI002243E974|nr:hypothetical protein [Photobacterium obscurum]MCW8327603.1 hypothetical protein [Photobacterium obscurum]